MALHGFKKSDLILDLKAFEVSRAIDGAIQALEDSQGNEWIAESGYYYRYSAHPHRAATYGSGFDPVDNESLRPTVPVFEYTLQFGD